MGASRGQSFRRITPPPILLTLGLQAQLCAQVVLHAFRWIDLIKQLADAMQLTTLLADLRGRRVPFHNGTVQ